MNFNLLLLFTCDQQVDYSPYKTFNSYENSSSDSYSLFRNKGE